MCPFKLIFQERRYNMEISNNLLQQVAELAKMQQLLEEEIKEKELMLKTTQESLRRIQEDLLPSVMQEIGLKSFVLTDGSTITIKDDIACSISKDGKPAAFLWLRSNGHGDLIKHTVSIDFNKEQDDKAVSFLAFCEKHNLQAADDLKVHPQTLKAFIKEQLAMGKEIPLDLFGAYPYSKAVIK